jgi:hypothetical protein
MGTRKSSYILGSEQIRGTAIVGVDNRRANRGRPGEARGGRPTVLTAAFRFCERERQLWNRNSSRSNFSSANVTLRYNGQTAALKAASLTNSYFRPVHLHREACDIRSEKCRHKRMSSPGRSSVDAAMRTNDLSRRECGL